jgi:hypothetical protein
VLLLLLLLAAVVVCGCAGGGESGGALRTESLGSDPVALPADYATVVYAHHPEGDTSFILSDVPVRRLLDGTVTEGQVMHVELLWQPKAGATPMDPSATNASIRHIVISGGELGVYGGAGFAMPRGKPGRDQLTITVRDATLRLLEATEGFADPLGAARVTGTFTAELDPRLTRKLQRAVTQFVTNALGRSRFVQLTEPTLIPGKANDLPF